MVMVELPNMSVEKNLRLPARSSTLYVARNKLTNFNRNLEVFYGLKLILLGSIQVC